MTTEKVIQLSYPLGSSRNEQNNYKTKLSVTDFRVVFFFKYSSLVLIIFTAVSAVDCARKFSNKRSESTRKIFARSASAMVRAASGSFFGVATRSV